MLGRWVISALLLLCAALATANPVVVRMRPPQGSADTSHAYFIGLAQLALDKTASQGPARIQLIRADMSQNRALLELSQGDVIDLDWAGTDREREQMLRPIRIPLLGGLLGYRALVIRKADKARFDRIKSVQELAKLTGIQGAQWPDTAILRHAGLKLETPPRFEMMYPMLLNRRADYFPRGLNEVYAEVAGLKRSELMIYDQLLLVYKLPMYFFTAKRNEALAKRIEQGLRLAVDDGSLLEYMKNHPVTAPVFPLSKYRTARKLQLTNPNLPAETPLHDSSLWLKIE
ncbi:MULTISPECIES: hypothetical protein [Chitinibacter]|uniref:hypothetical protein n=1 Tax=Chitinibacter TaxID=230666 RepID=UPI000646E819|nr:MULTISPECIES: hypothetical protein [Chitinibacter]